MKRQVRGITSIVLGACIALTSISAFGQGNPCPGGVCPPGGGSNDSVMVQPTYPPSSLVLRVVKTTINSTVINTNAGWFTESSNIKLSGSAGLAAYPASPTTESVTIGILNSSSNLAYEVETSVNAGSSWSTVAGPFVGSKTGGEHFTNISVSVTSAGRWYRVKQLDGFVIWAEIEAFGGSCSGDPTTHIANFLKPSGAGWGWKGDTNITHWTMTDIEQRGHSYSYFNDYFVSDCNEEVLKTGTPNSYIDRKYRFTIYGYNMTGAPVGLWLRGFLP